MRHTGRVDRLTVLAVLAVLGGAVGFWLGGGPDGEPRPAPPPAAAASTTTLRIAAPSPDPALRPAAASSVATAATPRTARLPRAFRDHARAALDAQIERAGLAQQLDEEDRRELMGALARFWRSARIRTRLPITARRQIERHTARLRDADQIFRQKLGIGLTQFIALYSPTGNLEDVQPPAP